VTWAREALEVEHAVADDADVFLGDRHEFAPQRVERVEVEPTRAALETRGVDEMWRADRRDVHGQPGVLAHEHAGRTRVVEVDVREQQMTEVGDGEAARGKFGAQRLDGRSR